MLYVDERGDEEQRAALADVFLGRLGGPHISRLPWVRKARHLVDVRPAAIALEPDGRGYRLRVGERIAATAVNPVESDVQVACGIPGYDRPGVELVAEELRVDDEPFAWELSRQLRLRHRLRLPLRVAGRPVFSTQGCKALQAL